MAETLIDLLDDDDSDQDCGATSGAYKTPAPTQKQRNDKEIILLDYTTPRPRIDSCQDDIIVLSSGNNVVHRTQYEKSPIPYVGAQTDRGKAKRKRKSSDSDSSDDDGVFNNLMHITLPCRPSNSGLKRSQTFAAESSSISHGPSLRRSNTYQVVSPIATAKRLEKPRKRDLARDSHETALYLDDDLGSSVKRSRSLSSDEGAPRSETVCLSSVKVSIGKSASKSQAVVQKSLFRRHDPDLLSAQRKRLSGAENTIGKKWKSGGFSDLEFSLVLHKRFSTEDPGKTMAAFCLASGVKITFNDDVPEGAVWFVEHSILRPERRLETYPFAVLVNESLDQPLVDPSDPGALMSNVLLFFWPPEDFLSRLGKGADSGGYFHLERKVISVKEAWSRASRKGRRGNFTKDSVNFIIVLRDIGQLAVNMRKKATDAAVAERFTDKGIEDAVVYLQLAHGCQTEYIDCKEKNLCEYIERCVTAAKKSLHHVAATTMETNFNHKGKSSALIHDTELVQGISTKGLSALQVQQTWVHQLMCLTSAEKAKGIAKKYPTFLSLAKEYYQSDMSPEQKAALLTDCTHMKTRQKKMSQKIYTFFTAVNPEQTLS